MCKSGALSIPETFGYLTFDWYRCTTSTPLLPVLSATKISCCHVLNCSALAYLQVCFVASRCSSRPLDWTPAANFVTNYSEADSLTHYLQYVWEPQLPQSVSDESSLQSIQTRTTTSLVCGRRHKTWERATLPHIEMARNDELLSLSRQQTGKDLECTPDTHKDVFWSTAAGAAHQLLTHCNKKQWPSWRGPGWTS